MIERVRPVHPKTVHRAIRTLEIGLSLMHGSVVGDTRGCIVEVEAKVKRGIGVGEGEIRGVRHCVGEFDSNDEISDVCLDV
jgi:hypothetical protein